MTKITNQDIFDKAEEYYQQQINQICKAVDIDSVHRNHLTLKSKFNQYQTRNWKFNSFHWANDVKRLADQLVYGFSKLKSHCKAYKDFTTDGQSSSNTYGPVSFYADTCILNLYSMRDKLALLVWSYFHPFNPNEKNEVLSYYQVLKRLKAPQNFGFNFDFQDNFVSALQWMSKSKDHFVQLEKYRHYKTHRWEPRIEIYGKKDYQGFPYTTINYDNDTPTPSIEFQKLEEVIWSYSTVEKIILHCMIDSYKCIYLCFELLSNSDIYNGKLENN